MKKRSEIFFSAVLVPLDYLMIAGAALAAHFLRFESFFTEIRPVIYELTLKEYLPAVLLLAIPWVGILALAGLYGMRSTRRLLDEVSRVFLANSTAMAGMIILIFFRREFFSSRFIVLAVWGLSIVFMLLARFLTRALQHYLFAKGVGAHRVALVGNTKSVAILSERFVDDLKMGYRLTTELRNFNDQAAKRLLKKVKEETVDEVWLTDIDLSAKERMALVNFCEEHHLIFKYSPDLFAAHSTNVSVETVAGIPMIEIKRTSLDGWGKVFKRLADVLVGAAAIVLLSPAMLVIAVLIKVDSAGPVIYKNTRVSRFGLFKTYKFRTMYMKYSTGEEYGGESALAYEQELIATQSARLGPVYKVLRDPRRTRVGYWLERASLDELPQFFNVLLGNMSLVGPRPHQPREVAAYERHHKKVLEIKPGITGLAQISGRSDLDFEDEVRLDTCYIENWSLLWDFFILLKTPLAVFRRHQ